MNDHGTAAGSRWRMLVRGLTGAAIMIAAGIAPVAAQEPRIDSLSSNLARLTARLDSLERGACPAAPLRLTSWQQTGEPATDSLATAIDRLADRLERVAAATCPGLPAVEQVEPVDELAAIRAAADSAVRQAGARPDTAVTTPPSGAGNLNALNPEISVTGDVRAEFRKGQDPPENNFFLREIEIAFQATLDPFSKAKVFLTAEEDEIGIEEAYLYWAGLPLNGRADAGKFRSEVGDLNRIHLHALPEGEYPLVYRRFFGDEGLVGVGLSLYDPLPLSIGGGTHEVWLQGTTVASPALAGDSRQVMLLGRLKNFWDLSPSTFIQVGLMGLGANSSVDTLKSRVYGADFRLTVRPPGKARRREFTLRTEGYLFHSTERGVTRDRYGWFADALFRLDRRWVFTTRFDWVESPRGALDTEWAVVPTITWWQSEFVYLRLEGRHEEGTILGGRTQIGLQVVFAFGPHRHEAY
ncbi:MAG: hypothetical protein V3R71_09540 [Gemmatimonadales bacterium]